MNDSSVAVPTALDEATDPSLLAAIVLHSERTHMNELTEHVAAALFIKGFKTARKLEVFLSKHPSNTHPSDSIRCATGACLQNLLCEGGRGRAVGHRIKARIYTSVLRREGRSAVVHASAFSVKNDIKTTSRGPTSKLRNLVD